jgi:hypothetical protein
MGNNSVCGETDDAGEVEAKREASGVSGGDEGYVRIDGLGITGASFDKGIQKANAGIEEPVLEFISRYYALGQHATSRKVHSSFLGMKS